MVFFRSPVVTATVADNALIVRTGGDRPRLWRGALTDAASATLEVREGSDGKVTVHRLMLVRADGTPDEIAAFTARKDAQRAFTVVSDRLMRGVAKAEAGRRFWLWRFMAGIVKAVVWLLFILMVIFIVSQIAMRGRTVDTASSSAPSAPAASAPPAGVAVPADDVFGE